MTSLDNYLDELLARGRAELSVAGMGRAGDEPEPLAHRLLTSMMAMDLPATFRSMCDSGGGGA